MGDPIYGAISLWFPPKKMFTEQFPSKFPPKKMFTEKFPS